MSKLPPAGSTMPATMSKSDFADLCNVNKSRVSHWIKEGRIGPNALSGTGRTARIIVEVAQAQLRGRLDPYQMMPGANGGHTKLDGKMVAEPSEAGVPLSPDAEKLMAILSDVPSDAAWDIAVEGESTQRAFDIFMNMRLNLTAFLRMRGFVLADDMEHFELVDWPGLAKEYGMTLIDPEVMRADWQRRREAE